VSVLGEVFISSTPFAKYIAVVNSYGHATILHAETVGRESMVGDIWLAKVIRPVPGHEAVFVSLGESRIAMLKGKVDPGIYLPVQVVRDNFGEKNPLLTDRPIFTGRYLIYEPHGKTDRVSRNIDDPKSKNKLMEILGEIHRSKGAFIARRLSNAANYDILKEEARMLVACAQETEFKAATSSSQQLLFSSGGLVGRIFREFAEEDKNIWFDDAQVYDNFINRDFIYSQNIKKWLKFSPEVDLFERYDLNSQWSKSLEPYVSLPSGGKLIIEETNACTTIDVDSGVKKKINSPKTACYEAITVSAAEIIRRNLAGLITIDLPLAYGKKETNKLCNLMKSELAKDRIQFDVLGITNGGLLEVTRRRIGQSLLHSVTKQDIKFPWLSRIWRPEITAHQLLCQARREVASGSASVTIYANPIVVELFSESNSISNWLNANFLIKENASLSHDNFEVHGR